MSTPSSTILSARDLEFMLFEWLDVERLSERPRFAEHDRESYDALLALCERLATDHFATHYRKSDTEEPVFDGEKVRLIPEIGAALAKLAEADLLTLTLDEELGGLQVPQVVASACTAWFTAANIGTAAYAFLTVANARLLLAHGTTEQVERLEVAQLLDVLTPVAKSWPSQWGQESNSLAIQVLGGSGYTRDHDVEAHWRDQRLNPIHEGTHGIQALDLLGRKVLGGGGAALLTLAGRMEETVARASDLGGEPESYAVALEAMVDRLGEVTSGLAALGDPERILANATVYLEAVGHVVVAWMWLEQLVAVGERAGDFYDGKRAAARYFFRWELPTVTPMLDLLASGDTTTLEMREAWF